MAGNKNSGRYPKGSRVGAVGTDDYERNVRTIRFNSELRHLPKFDTTDPDAVRDRFDLYLDKCMEYGMRPLYASLAMAMGLNEAVMTRLLKGNAAQLVNVTRAWPPESVEALREGYEFILSCFESAMVDPNNRNAAQLIFYSKNRFGFKDANESVSIKVDASKCLPSANEVAEKYAMMVGATVEDVRELPSGS